MNLLQFLGSVELGLIYGLVAIGVYLSFRVLDFPDLTVDGSFPMGAAIVAILIVEGVNPWLATLIAVGGGCLAGLVTAWLNVRWKILNLLASILTMTALYSVNLRIMGRPNLSLLDEETLFNAFHFLSFRSATLSVISAIVILCILGIFRFLSSEVGLALRATGKNARLATAQGIRPHSMILVGMAVSNGLVALAGALFTQTQSFADVNMGVGTILVGLAAVLIGEAFLPTRSVLWALIACIFGAILYMLVRAFALNSDALGVQASDFNFITALIVALAMVFSRYRQTLTRFLRPAAKEKDFS